MADDSDSLEAIESELEDQQAALRSYEILTYPADYTLEVLVQKYRNQDIIIPKFQRGLVWSRIQASRLIDSFLMGLPVPSVFLFTEADSDKLLVVDGQQRLRSIAYYFEGFFGPERNQRRDTFRLSGLDEGSPFSGLTYEDLREQMPVEFARLNNSVLRAFVMRQLLPHDDTSIYHVFERLNTGGTQLSSQEIRNCVHHGTLNELLHELNALPEWREIFGRPTADTRQRDVELILRFFALLEEGHKYFKPMKQFLNEFMADHKNLSPQHVERLRQIFIQTTSRVHSSLGDRPFHIRAGLNAAVFDSVYVSVAKNLEHTPDRFQEKYRSLIEDADYLDHVTSGTTDIAIVARRLGIALAILQ